VGPGVSIVKRETSTCQKDLGAAAVEFALILPLVVLLVFGLIDFGRLFFVKISLTSASREAARISTFYPNSCIPVSDPEAVGVISNSSDPCFALTTPNGSYVFRPVAKNGIKEVANKSAAGVLNISRIKNPNSELDIIFIKVCSLDPPPSSSADSNTEIIVSTPFDWLTPGLWALNSTYKVSSRSFMKCLD
jgi:hypothetical protein